MTLLQEADRKVLEEKFSELSNPINLVVFTQEMECQYCRETRQLAEEVAALSEQISLIVYDFIAHKEIAGQYNIDKIPATIVMLGGKAPKDYGIRYFGIPSGYEFSSIIEDILMIGVGETSLLADTKKWLAGLDSPIHLQVFVTPTCPYCPRAVLMAHQMAMESDMVTADMVEAIEFPHLSQKYAVQGVPRTVINETIHMEGAAPEPMLLTKLKEAVQ